MFVITGATGNTGRIVATTLLAKGQPVRAIGRSAERLQSLADKDAEPFVADLTDSRALTKAFKGARAVYAMIPPNMASPDFRAYQDRVADSIATAIEKAGVEHAVTLSSIGADKPDKTGPVVGLHYLEERLNRIPGLSVLHLRAGYFMENTLPQISAIKAMGTTAGILLPDLKLPMIAARDIGAAAAGALFALDFRGQQVRELLGQRDLNMNEATAVIGLTIDKPDLSYVRVSDEDAHKALLQMGLSPNMARLLIEMYNAMNSGYMRPLERRSPQNTTPTSFETFVAEEFLPRFEFIPQEAEVS